MNSEHAECFYELGTRGFKRVPHPTRGQKSVMHWQLCTGLHGTQSHKNLSEWCHNSWVTGIWWLTEKPPLKSHFSLAQPSPACLLNTLLWMPMPCEHYITGSVIWHGKLALGFFDFTFSGGQRAARKRQKATSGLLAGSGSDRKWRLSTWIKTSGSQKAARRRVKSNVGLALGRRITSASCARSKHAAWRFAATVH